MSYLELPLFTESKVLVVKIIVPPHLQEINIDQTIPADHGVLRVMTEKEGDKRFAWNPRSILEINEAKDFFDQCIREGLVAYRVGVNGDRAEVIDEFDPAAGEIIFIPIRAVRGG